MTQYPTRSRLPVNHWCLLNEAVGALDGWMSDFRAIARVALEDRP